MEPGGERGIAPVAPEAAVDLDKDLLRQVLRIGGVANHLIKGAVNTPLVTVHKGGERIHISLLRCKHQSFVTGRQ